MTQKVATKFLIVFWVSMLLLISPAGAMVCGHPVATLSHLDMSHPPASCSSPAKTLALTISELSAHCATIALPVWAGLTILFVPILVMGAILLAPSFWVLRPLTPPPRVFSL